MDASTLQRRQRLNEIRKTHDATVQGIHARYRAAYNAALVRNGVSVGRNALFSHFEHPEAFHEDEELLAAKEEFHQAMRLAIEAKTERIRNSRPANNLRFRR